MDPVFKDEKDGKWYFWNETWSDPLGPYDTKEEAHREFRRYCEILGGGH